MMAQEIGQSADAVRCLLAHRQVIEEAGAHLRERTPPIVITVARGSSDHAATFLKYAIELTLGIPVASMGPSIASVYQRDIHIGRGASLAISQSGHSPDIIALQTALKKAGGLSLAIVNNEASPLAHISDHVIPMKAGVEQSVAATKTFITSLVAGLALIAEWGDDHSLRCALQQLPGQLEATMQLDWSAAAKTIAQAKSLYIIGRGPGYAIAQEAALKLKETSRLHAEAYSGAEMMHGPLSLIEDNFPVFAFLIHDEALITMQDLVALLSDKNARVFTAGAAPTNGQSLHSIETKHPLTEPILLIAAFYRLAENIARLRGYNPDTPEHLSKVTKTY